MIIILGLVSSFLVICLLCSNDSILKNVCTLILILILSFFSLLSYDIIEIKDKVSAGTHVYKKTFTIQEMKLPDGTISSSDTIWENKLVPIEKQ